jgi:hypothetical protein
VRERLRQAALLLVDGALDRTGYELASETAQEDLDAAEAELGRLSDEQREPPLPELDAILRSIPSWGAVLEGVDVSAQREILAALIDRVTPSREGWRAWRTEITWNAMGRALEGTARSLAASDQTALAS